nr:uncharacterized protein LOC109164833 [Ipomoea batatas]
MSTGSVTEDDKENWSKMLTTIVVIDHIKMKHVMSLENFQDDRGQNHKMDNWDAEILDDLFEEADREQIWRIPISCNLKEDTIIWNEEEKGNYSVKSCYRLLRGEVETNNNKYWTRVWKLAIPPKVKNFIWQACSNLLPTADNLQKRKVNCPSLCTFCLASLETIDHLIIDCQFAKTCLQSIPNILMGVNMNLAEWITWHMSTLDVKSICQLLTSCWKIWEARNNKVWRNLNINPLTAAEEAKTFLEA